MKRAFLFATAGAMLHTFWATTVVAQNVHPIRRWNVSLGGAASVPSGWVQVRENRLDGTRLRVRNDLGVSHAYAVELGLGYRVSRASTIRLTLESNALDGRAVLPRDVLFNGTTLAGGSVLETRTHFPYFLRATVAAEQRLCALGKGGYVSGTAGLTFVMLTFQLQGTIASGSVGRETKEDFLTQELPVPLLGLALDYPLARSLGVRLALDGGYLPWMNSLRREGGEVKLTQRHLDLSTGLEYMLTSEMRAEVGYRYNYFLQCESSREDGNDVLLEESGARLGVTYRF